MVKIKDVVIVSACKTINNTRGGENGKALY